jgi:hypothetical protein
MQAKFQIKTVFPIETKNYLVIGGTILEGEIGKGMSFTINNKKLTIKSVEFIDGYGETNESLTGLLLEYKDEQEKQELEQLLSGISEISIFA